METETNKPTDSSEARQPVVGEPAVNIQGDVASDSSEPKLTSPENTPQDVPASESETDAPRRPSLVPGLRIQIGSLKDPQIAREAKPKPSFEAFPPRPRPVVATSQPTIDAPTSEPQAKPEQSGKLDAAADKARHQKEDEEVFKFAAPEPKPASQEPRKYPPPNIRAQLPPELERELEAALGGMSLDAILETGASAGNELEAEAKVTARVVAVHREDVFVDLGGQKQGVLSLVNFENPPAVGEPVEVVVVRFNAEDGLYEVNKPGTAVDVGNWSEVAEGMIVQAVVSGHNKGGLECTVSNLRGFMPVSQIALYRVDDLQQFVGQSFPVLVTEADPQRRNLVLSRRALLEREAAESKQKLLAELAPGQLREGVVRSLQNFGAFVDLGGVDGLIHISQLSWDRVQHPSEVLALGQKVQVRVEKIDPKTGKIGLSYRELVESPWKQVAAKYSVGNRITGTVSKLMQFGAFVKLEPGVEGLIHISELSHKRVWRASDVVSEGQSVEVQIVAIDTAAQRMSLSLKALEARLEPKKDEEAELEELETSEKPVVKKPAGPLKGGLGGPSGGEKFGLRW